jgi:hypothetical protein
VQAIGFMAEPASPAAAAASKFAGEFKVLTRASLSGVRAASPCPMDRTWTDKREI